MPRPYRFLCLVAVLAAMVVGCEPTKQAPHFYYSEGERVTLLDGRPAVVIDQSGENTYWIQYMSERGELKTDLAYDYALRGAPQAEQMTQVLDP